MRCRGRPFTESFPFADHPHRLLLQEIHSHKISEGEGGEYLHVVFVSR